MSTYGVQPTGFVRKGLPEILTDVEERMIEGLGPGVIQTPQSPLGVLNGLFANLTAQQWELLQDVYQSYDPNQAEGVRLNDLGSIRILTRASGETDESYRRRITNAERERADLSGLENALTELAGVTYVLVFANETDETNEFGLPPHNLAVAVVGGDEAEIVETIRQQTVEGLSTWGNLNAETIDPDGYARTVFFSRPVPTALHVDLLVTRTKAPRAPAIPSHVDIKAFVLNGLNGPSGLLNGETVSPARVAAAARIPGIEIISARLGRALDLPTERSIAFTFDELPLVTADTLQIIWTD